MLHTTAGAERIRGSLLTVEIRFMHVLARSLMLVALMTLSAAAAGCAYALSPPRIVEGRAFDRDKLAALAKSMQPDQVEKVLGPPIQRNRRGQDSVWTYETVHQLRGDTVLLFGVIPIRRPEKERYTAVLEFGPTGLERANYVERSSKGATSRRLLGK